MLHAVRDNEEFPGLDGDLAVAKLHSERSLDDEKEFVFRFVKVPVELALQLGQLHQLTVERTHDARVPVVTEQGELLGEIDRQHTLGSGIGGLRVRWCVGMVRWDDALGWCVGMVRWDGALTAQRFVRQAIGSGSEGDGEALPTRLTRGCGSLRPHAR